MEEDMGQKIFIGLFICIFHFAYADRDALVWAFQTLEYQSKLINHESQVLMSENDLNENVYAAQVKLKAIDQMKQVLTNEVLSQNTLRKDVRLDMKLDKIHKVFLALHYLEGHNDLKKVQTLMNDIQILKRWFLPPKPYEKSDGYPKPYRSYPKVRSYSRQ